MQSSMTPEKKSEYAKEALKKIGLKGQSHEMFHGLLTKLGHADSKGKQESDKPMFETPEQTEEGALGFQKREADQKESEELDLQKKKDAEALELDRQKFEETQRQKKVVYDSTIAFYQGQLKQVPDLPLTFEQQNERIMGISRSMEEAGRVYRGLPASEPKRPATPAAEMKPVTIQHPDGTEVSAYPTGVQGQYRTGDGKTVTTTGEDKIFSERAPAQPKDELTGEPKSYEWAVKKKDDPKATPEEKKTADAIIKKWNQEDEGREVRITVAQGAASGGSGIPPQAQGKTGDDALAGQPEGIRNLVREVASYQKRLPIGIAAGRPPWSTVAELVGPYSNWQWNEQKYETAQHMRTEYTNTSGSHTGAKILSLNTLTQHLGTFEKAVDALKAHDVQGVNRFLNFLGTQMGHPEVTNMATAKTAISDELSTALKQSGATDVSIQHWQDNFKNASSPEQFKGSIKEAYSLMAGRLKPIRDEYEGVMGTVDVPIVHKSSRPFFQAHGIDPDTLEEKGGTQQGSRPPLSSFEKK